MTSADERRWERLQQRLFEEYDGAGPTRISSQRTLFGIPSHVEQVIERVAAQETARCMDVARHDREERDGQGGAAD